MGAPITAASTMKRPVRLRRTAQVRRSFPRTAMYTNMYAAEQASCRNVLVNAASAMACSVEKNVEHVSAMLRTTVSSAQVSAAPNPYLIYRAVPSHFVSHAFPSVAGAGFVAEPCSSSCSSSAFAPYDFVYLYQRYRNSPTGVPQASL